MKALIVVASRHGATRGIANALAEELRQDGHTADVSPATDAPALARYDDGDFRDWATIRAWADEISATLPTATATEGALGSTLV